MFFQDTWFRTLIRHSWLLQFPKSFKIPWIWRAVQERAIASAFWETGPSRACSAMFIWRVWHIERLNLLQRKLHVFLFENQNTKIEKFTKIHFCKIKQKGYEFGLPVLPITYLRRKDTQISPKTYLRGGRPIQSFRRIRTTFCCHLDLHTSRCNGDEFPTHCSARAFFGLCLKRSRTRQAVRSGLWCISGRPTWCARIPDIIARCLLFYFSEKMRFMLLFAPCHVCNYLIYFVAFKLIPKFPSERNYVSVCPYFYALIFDWIFNFAVPGALFELMLTLCAMTPP
jgi:hypothetical protein